MPTTKGTTMKRLTAGLASLALASAALLGGAPATAAPVTPSTGVMVTMAKKGGKPGMSLNAARAAAWMVQFRMPLPARILYVTNNRIKGRCAGGTAVWTNYYWQRSCVIHYVAPRR